MIFFSFICLLDSVTLKTRSMSPPLNLTLSFIIWITGINNIEVLQIPDTGYCTCENIVMTAFYFISPGDLEI